MKKQFHMTQAGIEELQVELETRLKERSAIAERIGTARDFGDLAENAEYAVARAEQEQNESRIMEIENILQNVAVIKTPKNDNKVQLGSNVTLKAENGDQKTFTIVSTVEADPLNGKLSDESPIGKALMGKKLSEEVEIKTPVDTTSYIIAEIA